MPKKVVKILTIDGGGIRGLIPAMVIAELEKRMGKPVTEVFDLMAGTSIGALITMGLTLPNEQGKQRFSGEDMVGILEKEGPNIFSNTLWHRIFSAGSVFDAKYPHEGMEEVFDRYYAKHELKDAVTEVLIPSYEIETGEPFFFKRHDAREDERKNFFVKEVVMAATAAPTFFPPYKVEPTRNPVIPHMAFCDAVVYANNPAVCAYVEAKTLFPDAEEYLIVSLGTGEFSEQLLYELTNRWGVSQWIRFLFTVMMNGNSDMVDHQMKTLFKTKGDKLNHFYRFQIRLHEEEVTMDDASPQKTHILKLIGENLINDTTQQMDEVVKKLLEL